MDESLIAPATDAYQRAHADWMRNRTGSGLLEVQVIGLVAPLSLFVLKLLATTTTLLGRILMPAIEVGSKQGGTPPEPVNKWLVRFFVEFTVIVVPELLVVTCCSTITDHLHITGACLGATLSALLGWSAFRCYAKLDARRRDEIAEATFQGPMLNFVTSFRASILLLTSICILAVDFPAFPRRFAKTETYGTSLMDGGVGMFVISNAIVSPEARAVTHHHHHHHHYHHHGLKSTGLAATLSSALPLVVLGLGRVVVLKSIGYHENPSEYGTHWNFFFTLALVKILSTIIFAALGRNRRRPPAILSIVLTSLAIISGYQFALSECGLSSYLLGVDSMVESDAAICWTSLKNFLHRNRGGVSSCVGFLSLYLVGVAMGRGVFSEPKRGLWPRLKLIAKFFGVALLALVVLAVVCTFVEPVSRRLANLSYVASVVVVANVTLPLFMVSDLAAALVTASTDRTSTEVRRRRRTTRPASSELLNAIGQHGLAVFLLANLMTGVVNISVSTIYSSRRTALATLLVYSMSITFVASCWQRRRIKTKIWSQIFRS